MMKQTTCYSCDKPIEPEWLPEGEFIVCDECSSATDKLSVEKLQEIRVEELKDFNSKLLQAELKNQKLQEQLNTAKKALTGAIKDIEQFHEFAEKSLSKNYPHAFKSDSRFDYTRSAVNVLTDALAAIGGDDE